MAARRRSYRKGPERRAQIIARGRHAVDIDAEDAASLVIAASDGLQVQWLLEPTEVVPGRASWRLCDSSRPFTAIAAVTVPHGPVIAVWVPGRAAGLGGHGQRERAGGDGCAVSGGGLSAPGRG